MKKEKPSPTTAELLRRWISGEARLADERRLDQAAGEDPFLGDALKGYHSRADADHTAALQRMHERYNQKRRSKPVVLYLRRYAAIAATIALAVILWQVLDRQIDPAPATLSESKPAPALEPPTTPDQHETIAQTEKTTATPQLPSPIKPSQHIPDKEIVAPPIEPRDKVVADVPEFAAEGEEARIEAPPTADLALQEQEKDLAKEDIQEAKPTQNNDDAPQKQATTQAFQSNRAAAKKKEAAPGAAAPKAAEPEGGFDKMKKYVQKNLRYPAEAKAKGISGDVTVRFLISADGSPSQLEVVSGIGYGCDDEAKRLLREGPKWRFANASTWITYTIYFEN
ncbi:MAG: TonB family protein [Saprospiraceae bacterium]|nr:TonB family protein [Saprospiraceae bacterium]